MGDTTTLRRTATASIAAVVLAFVLTGCGSSDDSSSSSADNTASASAAPSDTSLDSSSESGDALTDYVNDAQASVPQLKKSFSSMYSDITITGSGASTLVYTYTYKKAVDPGTARASIEKIKGTLQKTCDAQVFPEMESRGISSPKVTYTYLNSDGSKIWAHTFTPSK